MSFEEREEEMYRMFKKHERQDSDWVRLVQVLQAAFQDGKKGDKSKDSDIIKSNDTIRGLKHIKQHNSSVTNSERMQYLEFFEALFSRANVVRPLSRRNYLIMLSGVDDVLSVYKTKGR